MKTIKAPAHLRPETAAWFRSVVKEFVLESHHVRLLTLAATAWDRAEEAREAIAEHGLTFGDRWGGVHPRPEIAIEVSSRTGFARCLRELQLDNVSPPESPRPAALKY